MTDETIDHYIVWQIYYYRRRRNRMTSSIPEKEDKYEMLIWMTNEFYEEFLQGGYFDASAKEEFGNLKDIYFRLKNRLQNNKFDGKDKENVSIFVTRMEEIMPEVERVYSMKAFW